MHSITPSFCALAAPPSRWVVHNHDAYQQAQAFGVLDQRYQQLSTGIFQGSLEVMQYEGVTIFRETLEQSVFQTGCSDPDHLTISWACELSQPAYWNGQYIGEEATIAFAPGREFELRSPNHAICVGISLPLGRLASIHPEKAPADWVRVFDSANCWSEVNDEKRNFHRRLSRYLEDFLALPDELIPGTGLNDTVDTILGHIDQLLESRTNTGQKLRTQSYPRIAKRARLMMLDRLDEALTISDLCSALGCSRRALQYAFESVYDMNPVAYLRNLRLHAARKALLMPRPGTTVQDVALACGFSHPSRFAKAYALMFGEQPSQSLARASH